MDITAVVAIDETTLQATVNLSPLPGDGGDAAAAPVQSVSLSVPNGWSASTTNTGGSVTLTLGLPTGFSLPSNASQGQWDTAYTERTRWDGGSTGLVAATGRASLGLGTAATSDATAYATVAQGGKADTAVQPAALTSGLAGKADLVGGLVPTSQIPSVAIVEYLGQAANQTAMLALRGQGGDWCIRADTATEWVIVANNGASLADWLQLPTGIAPVSSVNGQTGVVTLGTGDLEETGGKLFFNVARAIGAALTGFTAGAGTVAATDSILQALQKVVGNISNRALTGAIGNSGLTMVAGRILGRSAAGTGAPEEFGLLGLAFSGTNLATLADLIIPLSGETRGSTVGTLVTIPYWPRTTVLTDVPIWAVATAPTGAAMQFDIKVNGTTIFTSTLPTIATGVTDSTASGSIAGTFSSAFISAGSSIAAGSVVTVRLTQQATSGGAGLNVALFARRAG